MGGFGFGLVLSCLSRVLEQELEQELEKKVTKGAGEEN